MAHAWMNEQLSKMFLSDVRGGIPFAREQIEILTRLVMAAQPRLETFLDLGCGNGILGQALLQRSPAARGVFADFNTHMLETARAEVPEAQRHRFIQADLSRSDWNAELAAENGGFGAVVSGFAIHHLTDVRKRELYRQIYALLKPGGIFVNLEHVSSPTPWISKIHDALFVDSLWDYQVKKGGQKTFEQVAAMYRDRADNTANILAPVDVQCGWLRETGFAHVDCFMKVFELTVFGGIKAV